MNRENFSLNSFSHSVLLNTKIDRLFYFIASAGGLCSWFIGSAVFTGAEGKERKPQETAVTGDTFRWKWQNKPLEITGTVLESLPSKVFRFTFGKSFTVTMMIKEDGSRINLTLRQEYAEGAEHDDFAHINCCVCWVFFLTNLKSVIESSIDLRETLSDDEMLINL